MEFQEFWKQKQRMCEEKLCRENCDIYKLASFDDGCINNIYKYPKEAEAIVQKWVDEHPVQTNAEKFKEVFGEYSFKNGDDCDTCIYELPCRGCNWWNQEYIPQEREEK